MLHKYCEICGKEFTKPPETSLKAWGWRRYCSYPCYWQSKKGKTTWNKGRKFSKKIKIKNEQIDERKKGME